MTTGWLLAGLFLSGFASCLFCVLVVLWWLEPADEPGELADTITGVEPVDVPFQRHLDQRRGGHS